MKYPFLTLDDNDELKRYREVIESTAHLILEFAETGGFQNASSF